MSSKIGESRSLPSQVRRLNITHSRLTISSFAFRIAWPMRTVVKKGKRKGYWLEQANQRKFFTDLASQLGFNPLDASAWTSVTAEQVRRKKVTNNPSFESFPLNQIS